MKWLLLILLVVFAACTAPPEDAARAEVPTDSPTGNAVAPTDSRPIDWEASTFQFTGYGPGKSHVGTFEDISGEIQYANTQIVGANAVIQATSLKSEGERLENHLRSEDFFHVEVYPTIELSTVALEGNQMTAEVTFHGVTQELQFPVTRTEDGLSGEVVFSLADFNIEYTGVNDEVLIEFNIVPQ